MSDAELAKYLGIDGTPGWEHVIAILSKRQRAGFDNLRRAEEDIKLWQEGVGPKPVGVILCHDHSKKGARHG